MKTVGILYKVQHIRFSVNLMFVILLMFGVLCLVYSISVVQEAKIFLYKKVDILEPHKKTVFLMAIPIIRYVEV